MFKFLRKLRQNKNDADFEAGYAYTASCLLKGDKIAMFESECEDYFELGIEAALQDFNILNRKIVNTAMDELRKGLQKPKKRKPS